MLLAHYTSSRFRLWVSAQNAPVEEGVFSFYLFHSLTEIINFALHVFSSPNTKVFKIAEFVDTDWGETGKPQNPLPQLIRGIAEDNSLDKRRGVGGDYHRSASTFQKFLPHITAGRKLESKSRKPGAVNKTLKNRRHRGPP